MPIFQDTDITALLSDFGVIVTIGGVTKKGILDMQDQILADDAGQGGVIIPMITLTIRTSDYPSVKVGNSVTADGVAYIIRERMLMDDGGLTKLLLKKP